MTLTVGSLFSGIGGIDLGLERAGMNVLWHSEIDPYACRVLNKHWPHVPNIGNITEVDWSNVPYVDVIAGGYPCQPFSLAGKRAGENDPRHLWPYFRDAISHLRPRYALLENVRGHLTMGGVSVIGDLAALGYDCEWRVISAASVGANHRRDRLIVVAYTNNSRLQGRHNPKDTRWQDSDRHLGQSSPDVAYPSSRNGRYKEPEGLGEVFRQASELGESFSGCGSIAYWWHSEPDVGRVANGIPHRMDRLRGLGNAVVPQVAEVVGRLIVSHANA